MKYAPCKARPEGFKQAEWQQLALGKAPILLSRAKQLPKEVERQRAFRLTEHYQVVSKTYWKKKRVDKAWYEKKKKYERERASRPEVQKRRQDLALARQKQQS